MEQQGSTRGSPMKEISSLQSQMIIAGNSRNSNIILNNESQIMEILLLKVHSLKKLIS